MPVVLADPSLYERVTDVDDSLPHQTRAVSRFKQLFLNELLSDATVVLQDDQRIPVHVLPLQAASQAFRALFSDTWSRGSREVTINDCAASPCKSLLRSLPACVS